MYKRFAAKADFTTIDKLIYERHYLRVPDGGTLGLDFTPPFTSLPLDNRPIVICIHGLTGGSHESYVRSILSSITLPPPQGGLGWRGLVLNYRGCANVPITSSQFYHGGYTDDLRRTLLYLSQLCPQAPLYGIGFSLGANILAKYAGEEGSNTPLKGVVVLSNPWNFWKGHVALSSSKLGGIYSRAMASNLR